MSCKERFISAIIVILAIVSCSLIPACAIMLLFIDNYLSKIIGVILIIAIMLIIAVFSLMKYLDKITDERHKKETEERLEMWRNLK